MGYIDFGWLPTYLAGILFTCAVLAYTMGDHLVGDRYNASFVIATLCLLLAIWLWRNGAGEFVAVLVSACLFFRVQVVDRQNPTGRNSSP